MAGGFDQPGQAVGGQLGRRATAEEQRVDRPRRAEPGQFGRDRLQIAVDQIVAAGHEREIAIAAAMGTKRHVNVGRSRRIARQNARQNGRLGSPAAL